VSSCRTRSLNYRVGASKQWERNADAKCLGGLEIDDKFELGRSLDGQLARLLTLEDTIDIRSRAPMLVDKVGAVGLASHLHQRGIEVHKLSALDVAPPTYRSLRDGLP
jgi:hypothetical protein